MFGSPLKSILGFFVFLIVNQNIDTKLCMYVEITTITRIILNWTIQILLVKFVLSKCYSQQITLQKPWSHFSFFWNPNLE